mmetsp:Transcript_28557/g.80525  ORF Transcript_28557/g.80525 Transcript_28557/m.80525 type:complete len:257 (-) Transcript_28557:412-1182(-)
MWQYGSSPVMATSPVEKCQLSLKVGTVNPAASSNPLASWTIASALAEIPPPVANAAANFPCRNTCSPASLERVVMKPAIAEVMLPRSTGPPIKITSAHPRTCSRTSHLDMPITFMAEGAAPAASRPWDIASANVAVCCDVDAYAMSTFGLELGSPSSCLVIEALVWWRSKALCMDAVWSGNTATSETKNTTSAPNAGIPLMMQDPTARARDERLTLDSLSVDAAVSLLRQLQSTGKLCRCCGWRVQHCSISTSASP